MCVSSWQRVKKWDGEVAIFFCCFEIFEYCHQSWIRRHKEHGHSRKWWRSLFLDIKWYCLCCVFFWNAAGITLEFKMIPLHQRNIWVHTNELNPSVWPWILKSVNLKNYQTFQLIPLVVSGVIRLSNFAGGNQTMQMHGKCWRISLIIVHNFGWQYNDLWCFHWTNFMHVATPCHTCVRWKVSNLLVARWTRINRFPLLDKKGWSTPKSTIHMMFFVCF